QGSHCAGRREGSPQNAAETHRAKRHGDGTEWRDFSRVSYYSNPNCRAGRVRGRPAERFQAQGSDKEIAIARLKGFNPKRVKKYPVFKDPAKGFEPGTSLCRLGFPFYRIETEWVEATGRFQLKNTPLPIFPNEGILSRMAEIVLIDQ